MSKIERFLGKPMIVKIGGEEIELKPLTIKNVDILVGLGKEETKAESLKKLILTTLQKSFPDENIERLEDFSIAYFEDLVNGILAVNNIVVDAETRKKAMAEIDIPKS